MHDVKCMHDMLPGCDSRPSSPGLQSTPCLIWHAWVVFTCTCTRMQTAHVRMQSGQRLTPRGALRAGPPVFYDHATLCDSTAVATHACCGHTGARAAPVRASLATLQTAPTHHLDMPSPRPQQPFRSVDMHEAQGAPTTNTAPLLGPRPDLSNADSTTSASYSPAFQIRTHRTFNSEPAPRTRCSSSASGHFPPIHNADRSSIEASKLSRVFRSAIMGLPSDLACMRSIHTHMVEDMQEEPLSVEVSVEGPCHACDEPMSVECSTSIDQASGPLQPLVPHAAHEAAALMPAVPAAPIMMFPDDGAAANFATAPCACIMDMHDAPVELKCGPPGSREVRQRLCSGSC